MHTCHYRLSAALLVAVLTAVPALAQDPCVTNGVAQDTMAADPCGVCEQCATSCLWSSPTMTGDWLGYRSCLQESGVTFAGRVTQFGFGVDGGINTPLPPMLPMPLRQGDTFKYTGRGEYDLVFDLEKFGGLPAWIAARTG